MIEKILISLITEEVGSFLNEIKQYSEDEMVIPNQTDLQYEYDKLNNLLFDGSLPRVPLKWDMSKRRLGVVHVVRNRFTNEMKVTSLGMSKFYALTYRQFKNTLAHEMIHVKQVVTGEGGSHGWSFDREARRINNMGLGFDITHTNGEEVQLSAAAKSNTKALIAIIIDINGEYFLTVTTPAVYERDFQNLVNYYQRDVNRGRYKKVEITVIESKNPQLNAKRITRSYQRSFSYMKISDNFLEELLDDKIIKSIKINKGIPAEVSEELLPEANGEWEQIEIS